MRIASAAAALVKAIGFVAVLLVKAIGFVALLLLKIIGIVAVPPDGGGPDGRRTAAPFAPDGGGGPDARQPRRVPPDGDGGPDGRRLPDGASSPVREATDPPDRLSAHGRPRS